jgi:phenylacetate-CoA ligase
MSPETFSDKIRELHDLRDRIDRAIHTITGIRMNVELVKPQTLERFIGKSKRVIDHRREKGILPGG